MAVVKKKLTSGYYLLAGTVLQLVTIWIYGLARRSVCFQQNDPIYFN